MKNLKKYGSCALVAGAAEGLGAAFTNELAGQGFDLILVDKDESKLNKLADSLREIYSLNIRTCVIELAEKESAKKLRDLMKEAGCRLVIYNAAYGPVKKFLANSEEELHYYMDVNSRTPLLLIHSLALHKPGSEPVGFLLMSSMAGMLGTNLVAPYSATKAFNLNLSEGLYYELKPGGFDIMACIAGATDTPNFRSTNPSKSRFSPTPMSPEQVAHEALGKLGKQAYYIPGFSNKLTVFFLFRILGRKAALRIMNSTMRSMYDG